MPSGKRLFLKLNSPRKKAFGNPSLPAAIRNPFCARYKHRTK
ncbi:hypothetical protein BH09VER1_BH09VER1_56440 [soil metagenome]